MKHDLAGLMGHSEPVGAYVASAGRAQEAFRRRRAEYRLDERTVGELKRLSEDYVVVVFSAEWCPDCQRNVPVLDLISEATGLEVIVLGHIMRDAKSSAERWRIPPSPVEVREFNVVKIPLIVVLDRKGAEVGEIVENPPPGKTLEGALLDILRRT
jgi:thiol-disulfide isomerase/thioredoxin